MMCVLHATLLNSGDKSWFCKGTLTKWGEENERNVNFVWFGKKKSWFAKFTNARFALVCDSSVES